MRSSRPEVFSKEDAPRNEVNLQENTKTGVQSQQIRRNIRIFWPKML